VQSTRHYLNSLFKPSPTDSTNDGNSRSQLTGLPGSRNAEWDILQHLSGPPDTRTESLYVLAATLQQTSGRLLGDEADIEDTDEDCVKA
jgi:hypothetical protein